MRKSLNCILLVVLAGCSSGRSPVSDATTNPATTNPVAQRVRLIYVPGSSEGGSDWSHFSTPDKNGISIAFAHVTRGGQFPVQDAGGHTLFRVRMVTGDDDHVVLDVSDTVGARRIDLPRGDKEATVHMAGSDYGIGYPSVDVAATDANRLVPPTTDKAFIIITSISKRSANASP